MINEKEFGIVEMLSNEEVDSSCNRESLTQWTDLSPFDTLDHYTEERVLWGKNTKSLALRNMICLSPPLLLHEAIDAVVQTYWWPSVWCRQPHYTPKYSVIHTETSEEHCLTTSIVGRLLICTNNVSYIFYTIFSLPFSSYLEKFEPRHIKLLEAVS